MKKPSVPHSEKWSPAQSWSPQDWVPREEAVALIRSYTGDGDVAVRDPRQDMLAGRLRSAAAIYRGLLDKGPVQRVILRPEFWEKIEIRWMSTGQIRVLGKVEGGAFVGTWDFFVRRADLDKHYPVAASASETPTPLPSLGDASSSGRKRGRKRKTNWQSTVAREIHRHLKDGKPLPSAADLQQQCMLKINVHPGVSEINKLINQLLDRLLD